MTWGLVTSAWCSWQWRSSHGCPWWGIEHAAHPVLSGCSAGPRYGPSYSCNWKEGGQFKVRVKINLFLIAQEMSSYIASVYFPLNLHHVKQTGHVMKQWWEKEKLWLKTQEEGGVSPHQSVCKQHLYGSCWSKLSLANVDWLTLIEHTSRWLSCWVNTTRKERQVCPRLCSDSWRSHLYVT